ncbi:hypothetical protein IKG31_00050 [Candidatus Saccharibacteria bacterium]|nr:hypothetical protein [Candidatus Saccharibacteria bacterium]
MSSRKNKTKLAFSAIVLLLVLGFVTRPDNAFAASNNACIDKAIQKFGGKYVHVNYKSFEERCSTVPTSIRNATYGMFAQALPESGDIILPESDGKSDSLDFQGQRLVYSSDIVGDRWATYEVDARYARLSETMLHARTTGGQASWTAGDSTTVSVNTNYIINNLSIQDKVAEIALPYRSCLMGGSCNSGTIYLHFHPVTNIMHSGQQKVTYDEIDYSDDNMITIADDLGPLTFTHQLKRDDAWSNIRTQSLSQTYKTSIHDDNTIYDEDEIWNDITFDASGDYANITDSIDPSTLDIDSDTPSQVCSTITYKKVKSLFENYESANGETNNSTICVNVIKMADPEPEPDPDQEPEPSDDNEADDELTPPAPAVPNTGHITNKEGGAGTINIITIVGGIIAAILVALGTYRRLSVRSRINKF